MYINGIDFPNDIIDAINEGNLVVFAGAGVSMGKPTLLPDFGKLTEQIAVGTGQSCQRNESYEVFLGRLKHHGIDVNEIAAEKLSQMNLRHNDLHKYIVELFADISTLKIVTTNYDNMFEQVFEQMGIENVKVYDAPALPLGDDLRGVVHIHGNVKEPEYMVLTDEDFGKAYLLDGYVSRFLTKLFDTYTVLFVGYSYNDVIVRYLTRAMTRYQVHKRYILTDNKDGNWAELGIQPIIYEAGRFDILNDGIHKLGERIKRGLSDWKNSLSLIVQKPPMDLTVISELDFCLQDTSKVRILIDSLEGEEWLWWIEERGYLDNLFVLNAQLNETDLLWLNWLVEKYAEKNDKAIKKIILKHNNGICQELANCIMQKIVNNNALFSEVVLKEYLVLLDGYLTDSWIISSAIKVVMGRKIYSLGWHLFKKLFEFKMVLAEEMFPQSEDGFCFQHMILGNGYLIDDIWELYGEFYIEYNALEILNFGIDFIMKIHFYYVQAGMATGEMEPLELFHLTDYGDGECVEDSRDAIGILEKAIVEVCKRIQDVEKNRVRYYLEQCIKSESVLLRIIGFKLLRETVVFSSNEKKDLCLKKICNHSFIEKKQIFKLVADIFDDLDENDQNKILYEIEKGKDYGNEERNAYAKYNWAVWLKKKCKANIHVDEIIENIKAAYPRFQPREHPELSIWTCGGGYDDEISPINETEMKAMDVIQLLNLLKTYDEDKWEGPSRGGLLNTFANCIKEDFIWTCQILEVMVKELEYNLDVWSYFFQGLEKGNLGAEETIAILNILKSDSLIKIHDYEISKFLKKAIDSEDVQKSFCKYNKEFFDISLQIWRKRGEGKKVTNCRIIDKCYNDTMGVLALSWVKMLSYETKNGIPEKYKRLFGMILEEDDKEQAICILSGQMTFLFNRDREWCIKKLFPFLMSENVEEFRAAWEGITWFSGHLYKELADEMVSIYLCVIDRLDSLEGENRKRFIDIYTNILIYVVDNPIVEFIPRLFRIANKEDRKQFIDSIRRNLHRMSNKQKQYIWNMWLKDYWKNRIKNIPVSLEEYEKSEMLEWICELDELYSEAVEIIISGPRIGNIESHFWYELKRGEWAGRYPDETAKLITFLLNSNADLSYFHKEVREMAKMISCIDMKNQYALSEALLRRGVF